MSKHNLSGTRLHNIWCNMRERCNNSNHPQHKDYGGKGIYICGEWDDFTAFNEWALDNGYEETLTIDRVDNDAEYSPSNCRWTTRTVQNRNTRLLRKDNTSGFRGVSWCRFKSKWIAQIMVDNKRKQIAKCDFALHAAFKRDKYVIDNNLEHTLNFDWSK